MNHLLPNRVLTTRRSRAGERASVRTVLLFAVFFLLGIAVSAFWLYFTSARSPSGGTRGTSGAPVIQLSDSTRAVLSRLNSPLEIRFYDLLDPATVPEPVAAFAGRVDQILAAYQQAGGDNIKVTRVNSPSNLSANAAVADGIQAFNQDKGEACYLGLALVLKGHKERLPRLSPEWEQALEPDLTRAIARLLDATQPVSTPGAVSQVYTNALREVQTLIPDPGAVSVEEGKRILREATLKEFAAATTNMQTRVKEAEQLVDQAQKSGSDAERQAAIKHLLQVQADETEKLKHIAAKSKAQMDAFERLKTAPH